jgi:hypothetical protein
MCIGFLNFNSLQICILQEKTREEDRKMKAVNYYSCELEPCQVGKYSEGYLLSAVGMCI